MHDKITLIWNNNKTHLVSQNWAILVPVIQKKKIGKKFTEFDFHFQTMIFTESVALMSYYLGPMVTEPR